MKAILTIGMLLSVFRVALMGDPQVDTQQELDYARASIYSELRSRSDIDLVVVLGDLVNDKPDLLRPSRAALDSLPCPWVCAIGNHDRDFVKGEPRLTSNFREVLGYRDTAFVAGGMKWIVMDDVRLVGNGGYEGGFHEWQKEWLAKELSSTPEGMRAVIATHIPLNEFAARDSLEAVLSHHGDILLVAGHTHSVLRNVLALPGGRELDEIVAGASCGMWWRGLPDSHGIPKATMNSGDPRGYYIADFTRKGYRLRYKCVGYDAAGSATRLDDGSVAVNIYGGASWASVRVKSGRRWIKLENKPMVAPEVQEVIDYNLEKGRSWFREHREEFIPMRRLSSEHIWTIPLQDVPESGKLKLRYDDGVMRFRENMYISTR